MMGSDDLPADPEPSGVERAGGGPLEAQPDQPSAGDESRRSEEARADDDPFDRLRAELRRLESSEEGWKHRRPWRWLARWWRKPGDVQRP